MSDSSNSVGDFERYQQLVETGRLNSKLKAEMQAVLEKIQRDVDQTQERMQQIVNSQVDWYDREMKGVLSASDFMSEIEFQAHHNRFMEAALNKLMGTEDLPDNVAEFKVQLNDKIMQRFGKLKTDYGIKRMEAIDDAKAWVQETYAGFQKLVSTEMEMVKKKVEEMVMEGISNRFGPENNGALVVESKKELETLTATLFENVMLAVEQSGVTNLKSKERENQQKRVETILVAMKRDYDTKAEEILSRHPNGLDVSTLETYLNATKLEMTKLFEMEFKRKIGVDEPMDEYKQLLSVHIQKRRQTVITGNTKNLATFGKNSQLLQRETMSTSSSRSSMDAFPVLEKPLVFHLQSSRLSMATDLNGNVEILKNEFGEDITPAVVVFKPETSFLYGSAALTVIDGPPAPFCSPEKVVWTMKDFMMSSGNPLKSNPIVIQGKTHKVGAEFMLAFLLGKLKQAAEKQVQGRFTKVLLAIPFWLSSTQRIMVKDAATTAGFLNAYLVNESSAAAFNLVLSETRKGLISEVLVISEAMDRVYAFVYQYNSLEQKLKMLGHGDGSSSWDTDNSLIFTGWNGIKMALLRSGNFGFDQEDGSLNEIASNIRRACKAAVKKACQEFLVSKVETRECFYLTENWGKYSTTLESVTADYGRIKCCDIQNASAVMTGAVALSKKPLNIGIRIRDKLATAVTRSTHAVSLELMSEDQILPIEIQKVASVLKAGERSCDIVQRMQGKEHKIGMLNGKAMHSESLEINFQITNEAIVTLKHVSISAHNRRESSRLARDYQWETPNLKKPEVDQLAALLLTIFNEPRSLKIDSGIHQAKSALLQKCQEVSGKIKDGQWRIKSQLVRGKLNEQVADAIEFAKHKNSSLEDVQKRMNVLEKLCEKYDGKMVG